MSTTKIQSIPGLKNLFLKYSDDVRKRFEYLPKLLDDYPLEIALGYVFHRLELGQNMALYCGVVKLYRANSDVASGALDVHHMTREGFVKLYKTVSQKHRWVDGESANRRAQFQPSNLVHCQDSYRGPPLRRQADDRDALNQEMVLP